MKRVTIRNNWIVELAQLRSCRAVDKRHSILSPYVSVPLRIDTSSMTVSWRRGQEIKITEPERVVQCVVLPTLLGSYAEYPQPSDTPTNLRPPHHTVPDDSHSNNNNTGHPRQGACVNVDPVSPATTHMLCIRFFDLTVDLYLFHFFPLTFIRRHS